MKPVSKKPRKTKNRKRRPLPKNPALLTVVAAAMFLVVAAILANPVMRNDLYTLVGIAQGGAELQSVSLGTAAVPLEDGEVPFDAAVVSFLDVGQGDAVLLECGGEYALIDAGSATAKDDLLADLHALGVTSLRYLVATHPHEDHIGSMVEVLENIPVQTMLLPDFEKAPLPTSQTFETLMQSLVQEGVFSEVMHEGTRFSLGTGTLQVLCGSLENEDNYNLLSPVLLFETGEFQYLSAGDAEDENEEYALQQGVPLQADLFKASHHGSATSNTLEFMQAIQPALTVICYGADNRYGHPHREVLDTFEQTQTATLSTAENGMVRVFANEAGEMQVQAEYTAA